MRIATGRCQSELVNSVGACWWSCTSRCTTLHLFKALQYEVVAEPCCPGMPFAGEAVTAAVHADDPAGWDCDGCYSWVGFPPCW